MIELVGATHPETVSTRLAAVNWCRVSGGSAADAAATMRTLVPVTEQAFGIDHPASLNARHNAATWKGEAGQLREAVDELRDLLEHRLRVAADSDPDADVTRQCLVHWTHELLVGRLDEACCRGRSGAVAAAAADLATLVTDATDQLGREHLTTLRCRLRAAQWLSESGERVEADAAFDSLCSMLVRVLGADHTLTLECRHEMVRNRGRVPASKMQAVKELDALAADRSRVLGASHPDTTATKDLRRDIWVTTEEYVEFGKYVRDHEGEYEPLREAMRRALMHVPNTYPLLKPDETPRRRPRRRRR